MDALNNKPVTFGILVVLASVCVVMALYVHRNITANSDEFAAEVVQQQADVAALLHEYDRLTLAVETERLSKGEQVEETIETALTRTEVQLDAMRINYSFEPLDGAAEAHANVKPVLEDVRQWLTSGIPGVDKSREDVVSMISRRIAAPGDKLLLISTETDNVARQLVSNQTSYLTRFGKPLIFLLSAFAMFAAGIASLLARQRDLQYQIADERQVHAQRIKDFADSGADWFWEMNSDMRIRWLTGRLLSGQARPISKVGNSLPSFEHEVNDNDWPIQQLKQRAGFNDFETQWTTHDGAVKTLSVSGNPLFNSSGEFEGYRGVARDITSWKHMENKLELAYGDLIEAEARGRQQAEQALRDSEMFLRTSLDALPENLAILNQNGSVLEANTAWRKYVTEGTTSKNELQTGGIGWYFSDIFSRKEKAERIALEDVSSLINDVLNSISEASRTEIRFLVDDKTVWLAVAASAFQSNGNRYCVVAMEEVTDRKLLEEEDRQLRAELAHVSRLTTVGELATGLAHELNQPLAAISLNCDALISDLKEKNSFEKIDVEAINDIHNEANRAGAIIKGLRMKLRSM